MLTEQRDIFSPELFYQPTFKKCSKVTRNVVKIRDKGRFSMNITKFAGENFSLKTINKRSQ